MAHTPSFRSRSRADNDGLQLALVGLAAAIGVVLMLTAILLPGS